jgi:hypothetical protein
MQFAKIAGAGAGGGIIFWLLAAYANTVVFATLPIVGQILGSAILGAGAALVAVYLLTASDLNQTRTYVFAMVCGIIWQPILQAGANTARGLALKQTTSAVATKADDVNQSTANQSSAQIQQTVQSATPAVLDAVNAMSSANNPSQRDALSKGSGDAIDAIKKASAKAPEAGIESLKNVGAAALKAGEPSVANHVVESLASVGKNAKDPATRRAAAETLFSLSTSAQKYNLSGTRSLAEAEANKLILQGPADHPVGKK